MNYRDILARHKRTDASYECLECRRSCHETELFHPSCWTARQARKDAPPARGVYVRVAGGRWGDVVIALECEPTADAPVFSYEELLPLLDREGAADTVGAMYAIRKTFAGA